ncbi:collagenase-like isoform X1 [Trichoplusia ni]|uniref:Collagenase-like isoform X1 n=1 Tax=Trichoplusia ni TaxID=7111 RepID=A0A7E5VQJ9_TRINI|nr:collagenase-like isoform X1 [Trichoplusia ni]
MWAVVAFLAIAGVSANADTLQAVPETNADSRIVSGWEAQEGQFPYMIWLRTVRWTGDITSCGGSIIHRSWGMTSARCTAQRVEITVQAGVSLKAPRVTLHVTSSYRPPEYDDVLQPITQPNDISVIRFSQDLVFDNFIQPIRLQRSADMDRNYEGVKMTTSGWGSTETCTELTCPTPDILNWVHLSGWTNFMCLLVFNSNYLIRPTSICAGPYNVTSQSICAGDSGVPLTTIDVDGRVTQIGVGSFVSNFGCHVGLPGAFTRPGHYHAWIRQVTGINFDWNPTVAEEELKAQVPAADNLQKIKYY